MSFARENEQAIGLGLVIALIFVGAVFYAAVSINCMRTLKSEGLAHIERITGDMPALEQRFLINEVDKCMHKEAVIASETLSSWRFSISDDHLDQFSQKSLQTCAEAFVLKADSVSDLHSRNAMLVPYGIYPFTPKQLVEMTAENGDAVGGS